MQFITVGNRRYPRVSLRWKDIVGDSAMQTPKESRQLVCPTIWTEGYIFDSFEDGGEMYVRTFSTWAEIDDEVSFGDRNCFPISVLISESKDELERALLFMKEDSD